MSNELLDNLWDQYTDSNPHASYIYNLFLEKGDSPLNDHIALRTIDHPKVNIYVLAEAFTSKGYKICDDYDFKNKKLKAIHLEHSDKSLPKVFISQLLVDQLSESLQQTMNDCVESISDELLGNVDSLLLSGATWGDISYKKYQELLSESEYAAWFYVFGYRANHFTIFINSLNSFQEVADVNTFLKSNGITLNDYGGEIKGSPEELLEQSSTKSGVIEVDFSDGKHTIPCCYYEFAKRYKDSAENLYQGFVAKSADKIFESTNT